MKKINISNSKLKQRMKRKSNPDIVEAILLAKKQNPELARKISTSSRQKREMNLKELNEHSESGDTVIFPGKILGSGNLDKKIKIIALNFSESAMKKLKKEKIEAIKIVEALKHKKIQGRII